MKISKIATDPFLVLIALVVFVPAIFFAYSLAHQHIDGRDVKPASTEQPDIDNSLDVSDQQSGSDGDDRSNGQSQPATITQAEQIAPSTQAPLPTPAPVAEKPVCNEAAKATAATNRNQQLTSENQLHEQQRVKLFLISTVYRKYWDEEVSRHQAVLQNIEATYQAALAAANC